MLVEAISFNQDELALNAGTVGYSLSAFAFFVLTVLLLTSWRGRVQGALLVSCCAFSFLWSGVLAYHAAWGHPQSLLVPLAETLRDGVWLIFLARLLNPALDQALPGRSPPRLRLVMFGLMGLCLFLVLLHQLYWFKPEMMARVQGFDPRLFAHLVLVIAGLALVEQVFRNTRPDQRWAIKYLCFGLGAMFAYDFFLYSDALLFQRVDSAFWDSRGFVQLFVVPLLAVSAARNPNWSLDVFVSRRVVFHSAALLAAGVYLLVMAVGGYLIRLYGGDWGGIGQIAFLFGAGVVLVIMLFSGHMRARLRVFLSKHFFNYKYDYRQEWLNLISMLSTEHLGPGLRERVVEALAGIVDSSGGSLWWRQDHRYVVSGRWNFPEMEIAPGRDDALIRFMAERQWLVELDEYQLEPEIYGDLNLPEWCLALPQAWLIVPLAQRQELYGFVVLARPRAPRPINWEDRDLLKTVGSQAAGYLALAEASEALVDARQFEAFNRLSAYVVHDLKNVAGQLSLVVDNAKRFRHNEEFVDDAMATVGNAVTKMQRMLAQLRQGRQAPLSAVAVKLAPVVEEVVRARSSAKPVPVLVGSDPEIGVVAERDRLADVIQHIVSNAQDATPADGHVTLHLKRNDKYAIIEIQDDGCGMDNQFIREHLFRPFYTTKGNAGMGIGAYECREFIRGLGGDVEVESAPGKGALFRLLIPLSANLEVTANPMEG